MTINIVTDSTADLSPTICREWGITVVPAIVRFGHEVFRDGVDITPEDFYTRLATSPVHPHTSQPSPEDFANAFRQASATSQGVVSIHATAKLSGIYNSALQGKAIVGEKCPIVVLDSRFTSVGLGLVVLAAAKAARAGATMSEALTEARQAITEIKMLGLFDTMEYLIRSGRVSHIKGIASRILGIKPILTFKDGEIVQSGLARTYNRGVSKIVDFVKSQKRIVSLAIAHSRVPNRVAELKEKLADFISPETVMVSELGPALGVHGGPGVLAIAVRT